MTQENRKKETYLISDIPWGSHVCVFYKTKEELTDILVQYFKAGLENNEFCIWVVPEFLEAEEAKTALGKEVEDLSRYIEKGQIEIGSYQDCYIKEGRFSAFYMIDWWSKKEKEVLNQGFGGIRAAGDGTALLNTYDLALHLYEKEVNEIIQGHKIKAVCTYSLAVVDLGAILNLGIKHQFVVARGDRDWRIFKSCELAKIK